MNTDIETFSLQLRKAIEEVNSGTFVIPEDVEPDTPDKEHPNEDAPLLTNDQKTQNMITAMETDSIELDHNGTPKKLTINNNNITNNNNKSS